MQQRGKGRRTARAEAARQRRLEVFRVWSESGGTFVEVGPTIRTVASADTSDRMEGDRVGRSAFAARARIRRSVGKRRILAATIR